MNNYRITYHHARECDYWGHNKRGLQAESHPHFRAWADEHYPVIAALLAMIRAHGVEHQRVALVGAARHRPHGRPPRWAELYRLWRAARAR